MGFTSASYRSSLDWNYEATVAEIEAIITRIESGELELAEVFDQFSRAVDRLQQCETFLADRQKRMDLLIETLTDEIDL
ncbi:exodeoxyribonuclease VII small subunit [Leptolyngbya sp. 'hensonii']|nr:exodeoxyribonuclease VII small subunit [Leptolyngbya sp. 'hensonii']